MCNGHVKYSVSVSVSTGMQVLIFYSFRYHGYQTWYRCNSIF